MVKEILKSGEDLSKPYYSYKDKLEKIIEEANANAKKTEEELKNSPGVSRSTTTRVNKKMLIFSIFVVLVVLLFVIVFIIL
jgi:cell division protein FtsL